VAGREYEDRRCFPLTCGKLLNDTAGEVKPEKPGLTKSGVAVMNNLYQIVIMRVIRFYEASRPNRNPLDELRFSEQIRGILHRRLHLPRDRIYRKLNFSFIISYF
jgi:hypothetical protein